MLQNRDWDSSWESSSQQPCLVNDHSKIDKTRRVYFRGPDSLTYFLSFYIVTIVKRWYERHVCSFHGQTMRLLKPTFTSFAFFYCRYRWRKRRIWVKFDRIGLSIWNYSRCSSTTLIGWVTMNILDSRSTLCCYHRLTRAKIIGRVSKQKSSTNWSQYRMSSRPINSFDT